MHQWFGFVQALRRGLWALLPLLLLAPLAIGQSGGDFEIPRSTIDNGGGSSTAGDFSLTGVVGQPDAGGSTATGGGFQLRTGFFGAAYSEAAPSGELVFSNGFEG